jgi:septum formation protein
MVAMLGVPFVVCVARVDETMRHGERLDAYLDRVTRAKLEAVRATGLGDAAAVLVADTIVVSPGGEVLGKPVDECQVSGLTVDEEAYAMIGRLAGATHEVSTRFVLSEAATGAPVAHAQTVTTRVTFRSLAKGEAHAYVATGEGRDKAGGYAVQGSAASFIERIEGSYTGVVGLPLCELVVAMRSLGWW